MLSASEPRRYFNHRRSLCAGKGDASQPSLANISDERGPKASDAGSAGMAHAGINNAGRTAIEQCPRQALRLSIAIRIQVRGVAAVITNIVEVAAEIGKVVAVGAPFRLLPRGDFSQFFSKMIRHLGLRRFQCNSRIPGTSLWAIKSAAIRLGMGKCRIHNMIVRHAEDKLVYGNSWQQIALSEEPLIGSTIQFH